MLHNISNINILTKNLNLNSISNINPISNINLKLDIKKYIPKLKPQKEKIIPPFFKLSDYTYNEIKT